MLVWFALACASNEGFDTEDTATTAEPSPQPIEVDIPVDDLAGWLDSGEYLSWSTESRGLHPSDGPHFGDVLTYFSPSLLQSLESGNDPHPVGVASVKELFGSGDTVLGHAVMVRVGTGTGDRAWYWYEEYQGDLFADGRGVGLCTGCHSVGVDFVLSAP